MKILAILLGSSVLVPPSGAIATPSEINQPAITELEINRSIINQTQLKQPEIKQPEITTTTASEAIAEQINQARQWQSQGFYRRAKQLLETLHHHLKQQPDSEIKWVGLLNLGNVLRVSGDLNRSRWVLQQALNLANRRGNSEEIAISSLHLANTLIAIAPPGSTDAGGASRESEEPLVSQSFARLSDQSLTKVLAKNLAPALRQNAQRLYQVAATAGSPVQIAAQLSLLRIHLNHQDPQQSSQYLNQLQQQIKTNPDSQQSLYGKLELAHIFLQTKSELLPPAAIATILASAVQQAHRQQDRRAESMALGALGQLYTQQQQWEIAQQVTQAALLQSEATQAIDLSYQWQWQLGRIHQHLGQAETAIAHYQIAVDLLASLRQDLIAMSPHLGFSFREQVEPVYRELVDLLLLHATGSQQQPRLSQARRVIEALQLAELTNYFREACVDQPAQSIEQVDPQAAVIYPILLRDRLEVIVSIPGQPLHRSAINVPQDQITDTLYRMRQALRSTSFKQERDPLAQTLYNWLIRPVEADLQQHQIKTLVFVLDGELRNLPMAALSNGQQYLIEQYRIALTPSLQLFGSQTLNPNRLNALIAGYSQASPGFPALPGVVQEVQQIQQILPSQLLLDQAFTRKNISQRILAPSTNILHLASHGQFSSQSSQTFLVTADGRLTMGDLETLLQQRSQQNLPPIELLVLSGCQTAQGDRQASLGLAGVALRSGARSTLASLWTVNDQSTAIFMGQFYQALRQPKATRAEAVRQAQLNLLHSPEYAHPYYWAAFTLVGDWQ